MLTSELSALVWSESAIEATHEAGLGVLREAGVRVDSEQARGCLVSAGGTVAGDGRVRLGARAVERALEMVPSSFVLGARESACDLGVDAAPGPIHVHNLGETAVVLDSASGLSRPAGLADQVIATRLMHHFVDQHSVNPLLSPQDVPGELLPLYSYMAIASETDKFVSGPGISSAAQVRWLREMADVLIPDAEARGAVPLEIACSPVSPLHLGADVSEALIAAAQLGVVSLLLPCPTLGTTAPVTLSAGLALQHAEALASLVLAQAANPGAPCIYGARLSACDLRTATYFQGRPETGLAGAGATLLARSCGLAADVYGLTTDSSCVDAQYGYEKAICALTAASARPRLLSGVGQIQSGGAACLEAIVVDEEILAYVLYSAAAQPADAERLDVQAIVDGALRGGFLSSPHTRRFARSEPFRRPLGNVPDRLALEAARERFGAVLADPGPRLGDEMEQRLVDIISGAARSLGLTEWPDARSLLEDGRVAAAAMAEEARAGGQIFALTIQ